MCDPETHKLAAYRARLGQAPDGQVPCAKCGALISEDAVTCPECGIHFRGQAGDFAPRETQSRVVTKAIIWMLVVIFVLPVLWLIPMSCRT